MADFIQPFDPTASASGYFNCELQNGGWLIVHNESPIELQLSSGSTLAAFLVAAYTIRAKKIPLNVTRINWLQAGNISGAGQAPISLVFAEACAPDEWTGGEIYLPLVRLTNVGNQSSGGTTSDIVNDGNAPGTSIAEATPSDQITSSVSLNNDASGFEKVLSAGTQRFVRSVVRGNSGVGKATIAFGDSGDPSITTFNGNATSATTATTATSATSATSASSVPATGVTAGNLASGVKQQNGSTIVGINSAGGGGAGTQIWVGTSDPGGSAAEGDIWIKA